MYEKTGVVLYLIPHAVLGPLDSNGVMQKDKQNGNNTFIFTLYFTTYAWEMFSRNLEGLMAYARFGLVSFCSVHNMECVCFVKMLCTPI